MIFLTQPYAGEHWIVERLKAFHSEHSTSRLVVLDQSPEFFAPQDQSIYVLPKTSRHWRETLRFPAVSVIRNPLSVLADSQVPAASANGSASWEPAERILGELDCFEEVLMESSILTVRIEDFMTYPAVTLRRICHFLDRNIEIEMLRSFVKADAAPRRRWLSHAAQRFASIESQAPNDVEKTKPGTCIDMFNWVDRVPESTANRIFAKYQPFFRSHYPEIASLFSIESEPNQLRASLRHA